MLEERGAGDLAQVAEHCLQKLIRRHPHVFGDAKAESAGEVLSNWDRIKQSEEGREQGIFAEAVNPLREAIRHDPGNPHGHYLYALSLAAGGDFKAADRTETDLLA